MRCLIAIKWWLRDWGSWYLWIRGSRSKHWIGKYLPHFGIAKKVAGVRHYTVSYHAETVWGKLADWMVKEHWVILDHDGDVTEMVGRQYP